MEATMTMMRLAIDEGTKRKYNLRGEVISFEELRLLILGREGMAALDKVNAVAKKTGLNKMTMKEIDAEIKAYRNEKRRR
jgi:hypothetical protein